VERMPDSAEITMFICANCARSGKELTSAGRNRPSVPDFNLPGEVQQIIIPCTGRLQPEHVLRAFEAGSSIVSVVACQEDNCHYAEGSRRCSLRVDYIRSILKEIGLGEGRLLLSYLPGSASEDLALASGKSAHALSPDSLEAQMTELRKRMIEAFRNHPPNPLRLYSSKPQENLADIELELGEGAGDE
jgi:F420-non-reducing hydrogenase iron-sulfur subunit